MGDDQSAVPVEVRARVDDYIPVFYINIITNSCTYPRDSVASICL